MHCYQDGKNITGWQHTGDQIVPLRPNGRSVSLCERTRHDGTREGKRPQEMIQRVARTASKVKAGG